MISTSSPSAYIGFLDKNYCYKSVASHISHDARWYRSYKLVKNSPPPEIEQEIIINAKLDYGKNGP